MTLEDLAILRDLGIGIISLLILYILGKRVTDNSYKLLEEANKRGQDAHNQFIQFIETSYKENTAAMDRFCKIFEEHLRTKEVTIEMLKEQQQTIADELLERKKRVPKEYRK